MLDFLIYFVISPAFIVTVTGNDFCGEMAPVGNCLQKCYGACKESSKNAPSATDTELEAFGTTKNVCYGKCRGDDISNCLGQCGKPASAHCLAGYLAKFFYCDCHKCCKETAPNNLKCEYGCHEWFGKPDGPIGYDVCRFRDENQLTPNTWCGAFCTWNFVKAKGQNVNNVPDIMANKVGPCMTWCTSFVRAGSQMDYETVVEATCPTPNEPWRCITHAKIVKFIAKTVPTSQQLGQAHIESIINRGREFSYKMGGDETYEGEKYQHSFASRRCKQFGAAPNTDPYIAYDDVGYLLYQSYKEKKENVQINRNEFFIGNVTLQGCTLLNYAGYLYRLPNISIEYEIIAEISDRGRILPLTSAELKSAVQQQWSDLEYLGDEGLHKIKVKGKGTAMLNFDSKQRFKGVLKLECIDRCKVANRDLGKACKCGVDCE